MRSAQDDEPSTPARPAAPTRALQLARGCDVFLPAVASGFVALPVLTELIGGWPALAVCGIVLVALILRRRRLGSLPARAFSIGTIAAFLGLFFLKSLAGTAAATWPTPFIGVLWRADILRAHMTQDLIANDALVGSSRAEVRERLGRPDRAEDVDDAWQFDFAIIDPVFLVVDYDALGRVSSVRVRVAD